jgi:hypothetical protein
MVCERDRQCGPRRDTITAIIFLQRSVALLSLPGTPAGIADSRKNQAFTDC